MDKRCEFYRNSCYCALAPGVFETCNCNQDQCFLVEKKNCKYGDIYYAHHQWKYGTKIEAYELDLIRSHFPGKSILNPSTDIDQHRTEKEIMQDCIRRVASSEYLIFSSMDGVIGKGVYDEIKAAVSHRIPVYYLFHQDFLPHENFGFRKIKNAVDDRVYAHVYTFS